MSVPASAFETDEFADPDDGIRNVNDRLQKLNDAIQGEQEVILQCEQSINYMKSKKKCLQMVRTLQQGKIAYVALGAESYLQEYGIRKVRVWQSGFDDMVVIDLHLEKVTIYDACGPRKCKYKWDKEWVGHKIQQL